MHLEEALMFQNICHRVCLIVNICLVFIIPVFLQYNLIVSILEIYHGKFSFGTWKVIHLFQSNTPYQVIRSFILKTEMRGYLKIKTMMNIMMLKICCAPKNYSFH